MARPGSHVGTFLPPGPHYLTPLGRTLLVGRSEAAHVLVIDPIVSALHCAILGVEGGWQVRDLGSRNGTFVNGQRVTEVFLRAGDVLKIGNTIFRFEPSSEGRDDTPSSVAIALKQAVHLDPNATLSISMPADPTDALLTASLQEPRAVSALLNLSTLIDIAQSRHELVRDAVSMIADVVSARSASLWRAQAEEGAATPAVALEFSWGEEKVTRDARDELIALATARRQATASSLGEVGFAAALPLLARRSHLGAFYVERPTGFARRELEMLSVFATKLALALENDELTELLRRNNASLEAEVARRTAELEKLSEQRRDLLGMVAHDVRGALTFVKLLADPQALLAEGAKDPIALEALSQIGVRAAKTVDLLSSLLDTEALAEGKIELRLEDVDLVPLARGLLVPLDRWARSRKLALELDAAGPIFARTDPARFEQVIQNLVANAIKNTSEGTITVSITTGEGRARVHVADTGRGIPKDVLARLFKPMSTREPGSGRPRVGLGLAIAHRLVTLMGGTISVESAPAKGTTFSFDVPLAS